MSDGSCLVLPWTQSTPQPPALAADRDGDITALNWQTVQGIARGRSFPYIIVLEGAVKYHDVGRSNCPIVMSHLMHVSKVVVLLQHSPSARAFTSRDPHDFYTLQGESAFNSSRFKPGPSIWRDLRLFRARRDGFRRRDKQVVLYPHDETRGCPVHLVLH